MSRCLKKTSSARVEFKGCDHRRQYQRCRDRGLAIDASQNTVSGCTVALAAVHFSGASGSVSNSVITGAQLAMPLTCKTLFPGNGFGILVDNTAGRSGTFYVSITGNSIHDFNRDGVLINGAGITADVSGNAISGVGPSTGYNQFGVFVALGAVGRISHNSISQGNCLTIDVNTCVGLRSEGVVFRAPGDNSTADSNVITNVQSGIFLNGANLAKITGNIIMNVDALDGIDIQGAAARYFTNSLIEGNTISHVFPIGPTASANQTGSGIREYSGAGVSQNLIRYNTISDAYCGVAFVSADSTAWNVYLNTLYETVNADLYTASSFPAAVEP